ncbi:MAG: hypothetical protein ABF649_03650 [Bacillus sp. (in: firmicutes)]
MKRILFPMIDHFVSNSAFLGSPALHYDLPGDVVDLLVTHDSNSSL